MAQRMPVKAYAPASIGNVSLGFDILGAALKPLDGSLLGDEVTVSAANEFSLQVTGRFADKLPGSLADNIVAHAYHYFQQQLQQHQMAAGPAKMLLSKNLPIGSGLGSSASSIVAAFDALNQFYGSPFSSNQMLLMMGELEGQISGSVHYDNVAPCYLGGMTLMIEQGEQIATQLPIFADWYWVSCYSGLSVSTAAARKILPQQISLADSIKFGRQLGVFVDALHRGDRALAASMMTDVIAEPYRKSLLPGFDQSREFAMQNGALAFGISGSGPTVFAVTDDLAHAERIQQFLASHYIQSNDGFSHICKLDPNGSICSEGKEFGTV
ncbi:homoserine kinase [Neptunicella sp.]|uniref:homoserine kinase n=1 Tax=Neptunicella sp. TaxID=2125986 RepID=UPI003F69073A